MMDKTAILYSEYIIDGVQQELTPAQMLANVLTSVQDSGKESLHIKHWQLAGGRPNDGTKGRGGFAGQDDNSEERLDAGLEPIVDETLDPSFKALEFDGTKIKEYLKKVSAISPKSRTFQPAFAASLTKSQIATALIDTIWCKGQFSLGDLALKASWKWNTEPIGNMTAFYSSVEAAADYIDALGIRLADINVETAKSSRVDFSATLLRTEDEAEEDLLERFPYHSGSPELSSSRMLSDSLSSDKESWIVFIPFETCAPRLGGSVLAEALDASGGIPLDINDADYFIDCYEVVREFVEDGIAISGATVGPGGLLPALKRMTGLRTGAKIDLGGLIASSGEKDLVRLLFTEIPGAIIQIKDIDYDYIEAELLLQDVVFFPLGHPAGGTSDIEIAASDKSGIQNILESLINSQSSEGED